MARLIDADALREHWLTNGENEYIYDTNAFLDSIDEQLTVDAAPVVHGHWIFGEANHREYMKCSVCLKSQTPTGVYVYCPNCGAKLDERRDDG